jgi:hypothetical protein
MLRVPRPCVLRKGGYDAADGIGSNGSFVHRAKTIHSWQSGIRPSTGSGQALRNVRAGRGTQNCGNFGNSRSGPPAENSVRKMGLNQRPQQNQIAQAASPPTLAKNARMGHPLWEWRRQKIVKGGPPAILNFTEYNFGLGFIAQPYYADYNALDNTPPNVPLSDFFSLYTGPGSHGRPFVQISTPYPASYFQNYYATQNAMPAGPDTD